MTKERAIIILVLLGATVLFFVDVFLLPGVILPGPPYFIPVIVAAYFLPPRQTAGVAAWVTFLRVASDLAKQTPVWLLILYFIALLIISFLSIQLSARTRREAALAAEREQLRAEAEKRAIELETIVESIADAVFVCDSEGKVTLVNRAGLALVGEEKRESLPSLEDFLRNIQPCDSDGRPVPLADLGVARALHGEVSRGREEIVTHPKTHRQINLLISAAPLRDEANRIMGAVEVATDITRLKELAAESQRRAAELDAANKELQAFSYSVSHDLRAPLRHIDGFSKILLEAYVDKLDERGKQYLQFLREGSQKMERLIDAMLKLSRVTRVEMRCESVDLSELAGSILVELRKEQPERQVDWTIAPDVVVKGDPILLRVLLENLLGNAWKFTSKRPLAKIEFGITRQENKPVYYVKDNGAGFDATHVDKLFGAFQRLHREEEFPGTGVGLATVQRVIRRHGGSVFAEGEVDKGATFYFTLS